LIRKIEGFGKHVAIAGFKNLMIGDVEGFLKAVRERVEAKDTCVQFFDAGLVAGWEHLFFAALNALRAFESGRNISNSLAMEALLFASAQRQIRRALELLGIKPESASVAVLAVAEKRRMATETLEVVSELVHGERDDGVIELTDEKFEAIKRLFGISDLELQAQLKRSGLEKEALTELVIEHGALIATQR